MVSQWSEELNVKLGTRQDAMLPPFCFSIGVDVVTELPRAGVLNKMQCVDNLVMIHKTMHK